VIGRRWLAALALTALIAASTLLAAAALVPVDPSIGRSAGSTWSSAPAGWSGLYELLTAAGRDVRRFEGELRDLSPAPVVVAAHPDPPLTLEDQERLLALAERGATVVLATSAPLALLEARGVRLAPAIQAGPSLPALPSPLTRVEGTLAGRGGAAAQPVSGLAPLFFNEAGVRVGALAAGDGQILLLADTGLLDNSALRASANRALALALFAEGEGPVVFLEGLHGHSRRRGLAVWLWRQGWGGWILGAAALVGLALWRRAARLRPPPPSPRPAPAGLTGLAIAAGRTRLAAGDHRRALAGEVRAARARGLAAHPALEAAEQALRAGALSGEQALTLAVALERASTGDTRR
jgi:hypothetical protein